MVLQLRSRRFWVYCLAAIIALGLASRAGHTGFVVIDKYLGDALYASMVYAMLRLFRRPAPSAAWATIAMLSIESFQLTLIPAAMLASQHWTIRMCARLLGVQFSWLDLLAYAVGIACLYLLDPLPPKTDGR